VKSRNPGKRLGIAFKIGAIRHQQAKRVTDSKDPPLSFEAALSELETLVERMESGELTLEESLQSFEQGIALTRTCQQALAEAEQKVEILTSQDPQADAEPFESEP
jgi:exodeoxyribonuclease VII small subunit